MAETFTFRGHNGVGVVFRNALEAAGYTYVEAVQEARYVLTYCTSQTQLEDVYLDSDGLIQVSSPRTCLLDFSPSFLFLFYYDCAVGCCCYPLGSARISGRM